MAKTEKQKADEKAAAEKAAAEQAEKDAAKKAVAGLKVICRKDSFFRCGKKWTKEPITVAQDSFSPAQIEQLTDEPMLIVEAVEA
jgi:hypothetical protein